MDYREEEVFQKPLEKLRMIEEGKDLNHSMIFISSHQVLMHTKIPLSLLHVEQFQLSQPLLIWKVLQ